MPKSSYPSYNYLNNLFPAIMFRLLTKTSRDIRQSQQSSQTNSLAYEFCIDNMNLFDE